ncbi:MAG: MFS transporter [Zetaproteobacteria bacterium]|nr:MAG: MFS transporter [Zetaproteobacteria bacterium]
MTSTDPSVQRPFTLRSLVLSVYLPTFVFAVGQGAVLPVIPLFARELGAPVAAAGLIVGMRSLGTLLFDLPSGLAVARFGDKGAMVAGTALISVVALGASLSASPVVFGGLIFLMGGGWAFWQLARLAYVSDVTPVEYRGRALTLVGGVIRAGYFVGPILGGFLGKYYGLEAAFYAQAGMGVAASALMWVCVRDDSGSDRMGGRGLSQRLVETAVAHRRVFLAAGLPVLVLQLLREVRQVFLPLWGESIGLDVGQIGLAFGISYFVDTGLFYPVGCVMDRWGRKWAGVPSLLTLSLGMLLLPTTRTFVAFTIVAVLIGIGHGFGTGIVMTLGADLAPKDRRGEFLGVWRLLGDVGSTGGPFLASLVAGLGGLGLSATVCAGIGLVGTLVMGKLMPETLPRDGERRGRSHPR